MLAKSFADYSGSINFPVFTQPKLDGIRCLITRDGAFTRNGNRLNTLDHIQNEAKTVFNAYGPSVQALDGELYSHDLREKFEQIVSAVKQLRPTPHQIEKCKQTIQYHIYDYIPCDELSHISFSTRNFDLKALFKNASKYIKLVDTNFCSSKTELNEDYEMHLNNGYEGQMIRMNVEYEQKRTANLLKRKEFKDEEFLVVGYKESKGMREGCVVLKLVTKHGKPFDSVPIGGVEYLRFLWQKRFQLTGLYATVKYQNLSQDGIPRFNNTIRLRDENGEEMFK